MEHRPLEIEHHIPPAPHYNAYDTRRSTEASEQTSHISEESIHIGHTGSAGELVPNLAGPKVCPKSLAHTKFNKPNYYYY